MSILRTLSLAGILGAAACGVGAGSDSSNLAEAANAAGAAASCQPGVPDPRACDPADTMKTTICHIPPGNPANAHTLCVGNPAVPAHLAHGDHLGSCCDSPDGGTTTTPPPSPPPPAADGGAPTPAPGGDLGSSGPIS